MMLFSVSLSVVFFMQQSLRLDEAQSLWQSSRSAGNIIKLVSQDVHVPLYHELLHFWRLFLGDSVTSARAMSLFFYVLSIPAIYFLGRQAYGRSAGLYGALLLTISPFMNWYGNEIRMYTLLTFVSILNQYFFVRIITKGKLLYGSEQYTKMWVGYAVTAVLGVFVHYFFFLSLFSQAMFFFMRSSLFPEKSFRNFIIVVGFIMAFMAPWFAFVFSQGQAGFQTPLLPTPTSVNLFSTFSQFLFGFQNDNINTIFLSLWPITIILGFLALRRDMRLTPISQYLLVSVILSVTTAFFVSFIVPVFVSRYLIFTVPAMFLLLASLFESYTPRTATAFRFGLIGIMLLTLSIEIMNPTTPVKEDYKQAAQFISSRATVQDVVVLSAPFTVYPIQYYYRGDAPLVTLPIWDQYSHGGTPGLKAEDIPKEVTQIAGSSQNMWLLLSYDQGYQKDVQTYFNTHYQQLLKKEFSPGLILYEYKLRYDTTADSMIKPTTTSTQ